MTLLTEWYPIVFTGSTHTQKDETVQCTYTRGPQSWGTSESSAYHKMNLREGKRQEDPSSFFRENRRDREAQIPLVFLDPMILPLISVCNFFFRTLGG